MIWCIWMRVQIGAATVGSYNGQALMVACVIKHPPVWMVVAFYAAVEATTPKTLWCANVAIANSTGAARSNVMSV